MEFLGSTGVIHKKLFNRGIQIMEIERDKLYHLIAFLLECSEEIYGCFLTYVLILCFPYLGNLC